MSDAILHVLQMILITALCLGFKEKEMRLSKMIPKIYRIYSSVS